MVTSAAVSLNEPERAQPPVLSRLLHGTFWLTLRTPIQAILSFWTVRLMIEAIGKDANGAYTFAWGFGFLQFLLEFGMASALQRRVSETWTTGDREGLDRAVACGISFYASIALLQSAFLIAIAYFALPYSEWKGPSYDLIVKLLWLQVFTSPCYGVAMVVSSVLQAARRYDVIPRLELLIVVLRFFILVDGLWLGYDFFSVVVVQLVTGIVLSLGPGLWVMVKELGYLPQIGGVRLVDFKQLWQIGFSMFLIQLSVVLADKMDTTVLGFALDEPGPANTIYSVVSKPFMQIRQTGWMVSSLVMPAAASLVAANDLAAIERVKYDGSRLLIGLLLPVALLAGIYASPFLALWIGPEFAQEGYLLQLFLLAAAPLTLTILVQIAIATGRLDFIAWSSLSGAVVNLPLSYILTLRYGVAGVIWGSVLTVLVANLIVPGVYLFRILEVTPRGFLKRTLSAPLTGAMALVLATVGFQILIPPMSHAPGFLSRAWPLVLNLSVGTVAYLVGYQLAPSGRGDFAQLRQKLFRRAA